MPFGGLQLDSLLHWPKGSGGRNTSERNVSYDPRVNRDQLESEHFGSGSSYNQPISWSFAQLCLSLLASLHNCVKTSASQAVWKQNTTEIRINVTLGCRRFCLFESWLNTSCSVPGEETICWGHDVKIPKQTVKKDINAEGGASDWGKPCTCRDAQCRPI